MHLPNVPSATRPSASRTCCSTEPYLIAIGQFAVPVEMLLLVNRTFALLQDGVIVRRFSHVNHLAHASLGTSRCRCRDSEQWTADRSRETTARWFHRVRPLGGTVPGRSRHYSASSPCSTTSS